MDAQTKDILRREFEEKDKEDRERKRGFYTGRVFDDTFSVKRYRDAHVGADTVIGVVSKHDDSRPHKGRY